MVPVSEVTAKQLDPAIGDILVQCPMPEHQAEGPQRVEDFIQSEIGQRVLSPVIENIDELKRLGVDKDKAVNMAFAGFAVRDEQSGEIRRAVAEETDEKPWHNVADPEHKKKVAPTSQL